MMAWEEAFTPGTAIDPDTEQRPAAFAWKEDERFAVRAANAGLDVVLCPAHFLYLDIVQSLSYEERGLYWAAPALPLQRGLRLRAHRAFAAYGARGVCFEAGPWAAGESLDGDRGLRGQSRGDALPETPCCC